MKGGAPAPVLTPRGESWLAAAAFLVLVLACAFQPFGGGA